MHRIRSRPTIAAGLALAAALALAGGAWLAFGRTPAPAPKAEVTAAGTQAPTGTPSSSPRPTGSPSPSPTPKPAIACPLTGLPITDEAMLGSTALAVQIENHPAARPARNLTRADMVVEAPVEGDTTRFTAIVLCQRTAGLTGPVRSARYYNIDLWQDLGVLTVGFGASNGALDRFGAAHMPYVNGITGDWPWFRRAGSNAAPHNLYGDVEAVRSAFGSNPSLDGLSDRVGALRPPFGFDSDAALPAGRRVESLEIRTNSYWRIGWRWDEGHNGWQRLDAGMAISDAATGEPVVATSVVVQRVTQETVYGDPDPAGNPRRLQHLVGEGSGTIYVAGRAIDVQWSRPTAAERTTWTYAARGGGVVLPPGVVWWEIVPSSAGLSESSP
jgi:hypothetical protein